MPTHLLKFLQKNTDLGILFGFRTDLVVLIFCYLGIWAKTQIMVGGRHPLSAPQVKYTNCERHTLFLATSMLLALNIAYLDSHFYSSLRMHYSIIYTIMTEKSPQITHKVEVIEVRDDGKIWEWKGGLAGTVVIPDLRCR
jgi:hypothetical protein